MKKIWAVALLALACLTFTAASSAEEQEWQLFTPEGTYLTAVGEEPEIGDIYIAGDNRQYEVTQVTQGRAEAKYTGMFELPDVSWLDMASAMPVSALGDRRLLALYCTHSDESYSPSDGTYSDEERGSIYEIAHALADALEEKGAETEVSDELHHPHDAGAYRRSRQTAVQLLKSGPDAIFDIHRDGIKDPDEYAVTIGSKEASKIRILVGRGNQNMESNQDFAAMVKAVADKVYPGLIKDIYMGKGAYNQDLYPRALLFECGTYTLSKERVLTSMPMLGDVVYRAIYGGIVGSAGASDASQSSNAAAIKGGATEGAAQSDAGAGTGIAWVVGILVVGLVVYGFLATGSGKGMMHKVGRNVNEMTGGLLGKKPDGKDGEGTT